MAHARPRALFASVLQHGDFSGARREVLIRRLRGALPKPEEEPTVSIARVYLKKRLLSSSAT
jgi:hypothetical protein